MRTIALVAAFVGLACVGASAFADEVADISAPAPYQPREPLAREASKAFTPRAGDTQLKLTDTLPVSVVIPTASGIGVSVSSSLSAGLGYCVSDLAEVGGGLTVAVAAPSNQPTSTAFGVDAFLKFNFGGGDSASSRLNPYLTIDLAVLTTAGGGANAINLTLLQPTLNPGVEIMITHTWGINISVPIQVAFDLADANSKPIVILGLGYGVVTYF